ncbi:MAG: alpha/beta hydrolase [Planctomycetota bacterium]
MSINLNVMQVDGASAAVVVLPGGGYGFCSDRESENVGQWLNTLGYTAAILRYRVAPDRNPAPLEDATEAVRQIRAIDGIDRVGILGFSAGGHLAGWTSATLTSDQIQAAVLCYPVVSLTKPFAHGGSRDNLLGPDAPDALAEELSLETLVHDRMPPTFIWHTTHDEPVPPRNALLLASRLDDLGVPYELHLYERGHHGLSLLDDDPKAPREVVSWMTHAAEFLARHLPAR